MARRTTERDPISKVLTASEKRSALVRLESRLQDLQKLDLSAVQDPDDPAIQQIEQLIRSTLANIYGEGSAQYARLSFAGDLDMVEYNFVGFGGEDYSPTPPHKIRAGLEAGRKRAISVLKGEADAIREDLALEQPQPEQSAATSSSTGPVSKDIFVVHGHDEAAKITVARVLQAAGLNPVILHEQANNGKTIIEKFEKYGSAAGFAVVIATPDDWGRADKETDLKRRARQNVIGEMFWFAGRLGRDKVCALVKGTIEMPSDFAGVIYTPMDDHGGWKAKMLQELDAAGYKDLNWPAALA